MKKKMNLNSIYILWSLILLFAGQQNVRCNAQNSTLVTCNVCGNDPDAFMSSNSTLIDITYLNLTNNGTQVTEASCSEIYQAGADGFFYQNECDLLVNDESIQSSCGCSNYVQPACYICDGNADATISSNDTVIDVAYLNLVDDSGTAVLQATCGEILQAGVDGFFFSDECSLITTDRLIQSQCGCSNYVADATCGICLGDPNISPINVSNVVDTSFLNVIQYQQQTCGGMYTAGLDGVYTADECTQISSNTTIQTSCGCVSDNTNQTGACYVCGGDENQPVTSPSSVVDLTFLNISIYTNDTCSGVYAQGVGGFFLEDECTAIIANNSFQTICCEPRPTPSPSPSPVTTPLPTSVTTSVTTPVTTSVTTPVTSAPPTKAPSQRSPVASSVRSP